MEAQEKNNIPRHIGIIMDGNRRWAKKRGLPVLEGHRRGYDKVKNVGRWCKDMGVEILTLWAFSTENWERSKKEVEYLMRLFKLALSKKEIARLNKDGIRLKVIGQRERFSKDIRELMKEAEARTKNNKEGLLNLALSYGGRAEIIQAIKNIVGKKIPASKITEQLVSDNLWTAGQSFPDLIIRTSGEQRTSGFLLWQSAYSELYFFDKCWPDFTEKDLKEAVENYKNRERRFGR